MYKVDLGMSGLAALRPNYGNCQTVHELRKYVKRVKGFYSDRRVIVIVELPDGTQVDYDDYDWDGEA